MDKTTTSIKQAALDYYEAGWAPIPIKAHSKHPDLIELEPYLQRRATLEELDAWSWRGVGIVTGPVSGLLVLDADGEEGLAELERRKHPATATAQTAGGGRHLYFVHPKGSIRTRIRVAPGIDVKAARGYVVAPPSKGYDWIIPPSDGLADPPPWLMELLEQARGTGAAAPVGEEIPSGKRNATLFSLAGSMRRRGMGEEEIFAALVTTNELRCKPPLEEREVRQIAHSGTRYDPVVSVTLKRSANGYEGNGHAPDRFHLTDLGNAERFVAQHGADLRYCHLWSKWLVYDGSRWIIDTLGAVHQRACRTVRGIYAEAAAEPDEAERKKVATWAVKSEARIRIDAMLNLAESQPGIPVGPEELDADLWLLNVQNGTVDLRSGELREHRREDLITKLAPVNFEEDAEAPTWRAFLERVQPNEEIRGFLQRASGYSATGATSEQCLFIDTGTGSNGKSTYQEALHHTLGDYAMRAPAEMLLAHRPGGVPNDIARLKGARYVTASETGEGRQLNEARVKELTGQDTITARFMRAEFFDFIPTHKLHLATNHKPEIRGTDLAIWRRIRLIPWSITIPPAEQDRKLLERLLEERTGILNWIIGGAREWYREGLKAPDEVRQATMAYRAEMDVLADFISDCCIVGEDEYESATALFEAWKSWCETRNETAGSQKAFGARLSERGFRNRDPETNKPLRDPKTRRSIWKGVSLRPDWDNHLVTTRNHSNVQFAGKTENRETIKGEKHITQGNSTSRAVICKKGSEGFEGFEKRPLSWDANPGESTSLPELEKRPQANQGQSSPGDGEKECIHNVSGGCWLCKREVQKLVEQGTDPEIARAEVLREEEL